MNRTASAGATRHCFHEAAWSARSFAYRNSRNAALGRETAPAQPLDRPSAQAFADYDNLRAAFVGRLRNAEPATEQKKRRKDRKGKTQVFGQSTRGEEAQLVDEVMRGGYANHFAQTSFLALPFPIQE